MAHHEPFKSLGPIDWSEVEGPDGSALPSLLEKSFADAQILVNSIPTGAGSSHSSGRARSKTESAVGGPPALDPAASSPHIAPLRKEWREVKVNPRENPMSIQVYKLASKDGKGAWFARRSVHEGMTFEKWQLGLEREFSETLKANTGNPGNDEPATGNVRGIGAERKIAKKVVDEKGKAEVYQLSIRFPGPTTPRDFVTLLLSSNTHKASGEKGKKRGPRQFMLVSKPCEHPDCPPRSAFIRGQYESVEVIREIPIGRTLRKTRSSMDLRRESARPTSSASQKQSARKAGSDEDSTTNRAVSFADQADDEEEEMAIEWLMVTRSDPGGSVPRFMVERGTPGGIVNDAGKFVNWVSAKSADEFEAEEGDDFKQKAQAVESNAPTKPSSRPQSQSQSQSQSPVAARSTPAAPVSMPAPEESQPTGIYGMIAGALGAVADKMPALVGSGGNSPDFGGSADDDESDTSELSFESALEGSITPAGLSTLDVKDAETARSLRSNLSEESQAASTATSHHDKQLRKLQERQRKVQEKINRAAERAAAKKRDDNDKDAAALAKLREKHQNELARQEERFQRDLRKLEQKRQHDERKAEERRRKQQEREEKNNAHLELERVRVERDLARKELEVLKDQVGELQAQNTLLVAKLGRLGALGRVDSRDDLAKAKEKPLAEGISA